MSEFKRKLGLATSDLGRRSGLKLAAGLGVVTAAGFLIAAFWSLLARELALGPTMASLIIGLVLLVIAGLLLLLGRHARHQMPSMGELGDEVRAKASLAALTALAEARAGLASARDGASDKVRSIFTKERAAPSAAQADEASHPPGADGAAPNEPPPKDGFDFDSISESLGQAGDAIGDALQHFRQSRAAPAVGLAGAFALGFALAQAFGWEEEDAEEPSPQPPDKEAPDPTPPPQG